MNDKQALFPAAVSLGIPAITKAVQTGTNIANNASKLGPQVTQGLLDNIKGFGKGIADKAKAIDARPLKLDSFEGAVAGMLPQAATNFMTNNLSRENRLRALRALGGAGIGMLGGAGIGALSSMFGSDEDEEGNKKKKRGLLSSALTGGLLGGGLGAAAGGIDPVYNTIAGFMGKKAAELQKKALYVEEGGPISRLVASTVGRVNPGSLPNLLLSKNTYVDPSRKGIFWKDEEKFNKNKEEAETIAKYDPEALSDTVVRLGGTNLIDDLIWKKNRGENDPWYKRVGGRTFHNKKTGLISKLLGAPGVLAASLTTPLVRGSHYNPVTDTISEYANEHAILQHELGHALDHNRLYGIRPGSKDDGFLKRQAKGLAHDLYSVSYGLNPVSMLLQEARANQLSHRALEEVLGKDSPEYKERVKRRWEVLPAGFGSYLGGLTMGMPLPGLVAGKVLGMAAGKGQELEDQEAERKAKEESDSQEKPKIRKAASQKQARNLNLSSMADISQGGRGALMGHALNMLMQARAIARPTNEDLKMYGVDRGGFENLASEIARKSDEDPTGKLNLAKVKASPKGRAIGYGLAGAVPMGLLSYLTGGSPATIATSALAGGGAGAAIGGLSAREKNKKLLATANLLRDYGILTSGDLKKSLPLISDKTAADKKAFLAWGGGSLGLHPKGLGVGGELGYTNLLGVLPIPIGGLDIGGPNKGFQIGVNADPGSEIGVNPYLGFRWNHPRRTGITRSFPRGLPEVIYDKLRGRTKEDAIRASYPELFTEEEETAKEETKKDTKDKKEKAAAAKPGLWANIHAKRQRGESPAKPGDKDYPDAKNWKKVTEESEKTAAPAWQTSEGKSESGGLNDKGRASLKAQGHDIKRPQPEGGPRKDSFCARMKGMKAKLTSEETANDPDSRINKALRKWKCGSASEKLANVLKEARCWKGYVPVPGKKPYSEDSCKPAGETETKKKESKK